jgi:hypothetical protein
MPAPTPFTYAASLSYAPDIGAANAIIPVNMAGTFSSKADFEYRLSGAGTQVVDFGTIAPNGAKLISIEVDPDTSPAVAALMVQVNGGGAGGQLEIAPGGFMTVGNPSPTALGILSLELVHTTNLGVRVRVLG